MEDKTLGRIAAGSVAGSFLLGMISGVLPNFPTVALSSPFALIIYGVGVSIFYKSAESEEGLKDIEKVFLAIFTVLALVPIQIGGMLL